MSEESSIAQYGLGPLSRLLGYHFRRTSTLFRKDFEQAAGDSGIRQVSFGVMSVISANPGIRQGDVGTILDIQRANMVTLIGELSDAGLVERGTDGNDRRVVRLSLSNRGESLLAEVTRRIEEQEAALLDGFDDDEIAALIAMLHRIARNAQGEGERPASPSNKDGS